MQEKRRGNEENEGAFAADSASPQPTVLRHVRPPAPAAVLPISGDRLRLFPHHSRSWTLREQRTVTFPPPSPICRVRLSSIARAIMACGRSLMRLGSQRSLGYTRSSMPLRLFSTAAPLQEAKVVTRGGTPNMRDQPRPGKWQSLYHLWYTQLIGYIGY